MSVSHPVPPGSKTKLTYEHYCLFPEDGNRHEIVDGIHYMNAAPTPYHQQLSAAISHQLYAAITAEDLGCVYPAPIDVQFTEHDVVQPDIAVVLKENRIVTQSKIKGAPDLIIEILSPSTSSRDLSLKKELYEQNSVPEYWVVDPDEKSVRKFTFETNQYSEPTKHIDSIRFDRLTGVEIDLTRVW